MSWLRKAFTINIIFWIVSPALFVALRMSCFLDRLLIDNEWPGIGACVDTPWDWIVFLCFAVASFVSAFLNFERDK